MAGRKSKYETHIEPSFEVILGYLRTGQTEKSIAKSLGVGRSAWDRYKKLFRPFWQLVKKAAFDSNHGM